jgi:alanine racemase
LRGNLVLLRGLAGPGVPIRPVVKADAYGHGALQVALALEAAGIDALCVATMDEALELRAGGVAGPILVLYPVPAAWVSGAAALGIGLVAGDRPGLVALLEAASGIDATKPLAVEVEVETGLGRGGFLEADLVAAARRIDAAPGVVLAGLWTHLQAPEDAVISAAQVARFETAAAAVTAAGIELPRRHLAAIAGGTSAGPSSSGITP